MLGTLPILLPLFDEDKVDTEGCLIGFTSEADEIGGCGTNMNTARIAGFHNAEPNCRTGTRICGLASLSLSQNSFRIMHFLEHTSMRAPDWSSYADQQKAPTPQKLPRTSLSSTF
jgi:hypothetical protein